MLAFFALAYAKTRTFLKPCVKLKLLATHYIFSHNALTGIAYNFSPSDNILSSKKQCINQNNYFSFIT